MRCRQALASLNARLMLLQRRPQTRVKQQISVPKSHRQGGLCLLRQRRLDVGRGGGSEGRSRSPYWLLWSSWLSGYAKGPPDVPIRRYIRERSDRRSSGGLVQIVRHSQREAGRGDEATVTHSAPEN